MRIWRQRGNIGRPSVLLDERPHSAILHGDQDYDSDTIRRQAEGKDAMLNLPPNANRHRKDASRPSSIETATPSSACSVA
jgi:hypothetical protein